MFKTFNVNVILLIKVSYHYEKVNQIKYLSGKKCPNCPLCISSFLWIAKVLLAPTAEYKITGNEYAERVSESTHECSIKLNFSHTTISLFFPPNSFQTYVSPIPKLTFHVLPSSAVLWLPFLNSKWWLCSAMCLVMY